MKKILALAAPIFLSNVAVAGAASSTGPVALALAAVVAGHSVALTGAQKQAMARLFDGDLRGITPQTRNIVVTAGSIICRASNVDITTRGCTLTFGRANVAIGGRRANELFATMALSGVPSQGAAGTTYESLTRLRCAISPQAIRRRNGGGANCTYLPE